MYKAKICVTLKTTVNDPEGFTINRAIGRLGFKKITSLRVGKYFEMIIDNDDEESVKKTTDSICSELLSNPVIETYNFTVEKI